MDLDSTDTEERAAASFGMHLHNKWGVGLETPCGGTGILMFLSIQDRAIYISTGSAVKPMLTDSRLDRVINLMKPYLREENYIDALQTAIENIGLYIESGEPELRERIMTTLTEFLPFVFFGTILLAFLAQWWRERRQQREYAKVQSQLSELDRSRAEALQGRYQCTSCPICFEEFQVRNDGSETTGEERSKVGSDGLPLKLLRCGHVFDHTCWTEWVEKGQGVVSRCPVCNQDVGVGTPNSDQVAPDNGNRVVRQRNGNDALREAERGALRRFNQERMFRLVRLNNMFPHFVNEQQVQRWSDHSYDGSLSQDRSFLRNNPQQTMQTSRGGYSSSGRSFGGGGSFGGGSSGGGRSGRW